ncbi:MAG: diacylglycerol kinase family protein [Dehalococcoidia bacterium]
MPAKVSSNHKHASHLSSSSCAFTIVRIVNTCIRGYDRKEALVIVNPVAHNAPRAHRRGEVDELMHSAGWTVRWEETVEPGQAKALAGRAAESGVPLVIACGGDGTVNEVANGIVGSRTALGTIPSGMSNIWAREAGLDHKTVEAMRLMITGERRLVDMGKSGGRHFLLLAGFGIDASITENVRPGVKDKIGTASYILSAFQEMLRWKGVPATVRFDGYERHVDFLMALVGNTRLYAGLTKIASRAVINDGRLDVCVYEGDGTRDIVLHAIRTIAQIHRKSDKALYRRVNKVEFQWDARIPVQLDGEVLGQFPTEAEVVPASLWVAVPEAYVSKLFMPEVVPVSAPGLNLARPRTA